MKKLFGVLMAMIYSNFVLAVQGMHTQEEYSTPKGIVYIILGVILITVIAWVLYGRPKRKFNE